MKQLTDEYLQLFKIDYEHPELLKAYQTLNKSYSTVFKTDFNKTVFLDFVYSDKSDINIKLLLFTKIINRIKKMLTYFGSNFPEEIINISLFLYEMPRVINFKASEPLKDAINKGSFGIPAGVCVRDRNPTSTTNVNIICTRLNNILGLLVHELGHLCFLDETQNPDIVAFNKVYKKLFNTKGELFEGINNAKASILHAAFTAKELNKPFQKILSDEINHARLMVEYWRMLGCPIITDSQIFEYIFIRWVCLKHALNIKNDFIDLIKKEFNYYHPIPKDPNLEIVSFEYFKY